VGRVAPDPDLQLDQLIDKRAAQNPADERREELWQASVRAYHKQRSLDFSQAWLEHHRHLARTHLSLSDMHLERCLFLEQLIAEREAC
jgi:hypothetical protein